MRASPWHVETKTEPDHHPRTRAWVVWSPGPSRAAPHRPKARRSRGLLWWVLRGDHSMGQAVGTG